jgi:hypothetical protein
MQKQSDSSPCDVVILNAAKRSEESQRSLLTIMVVNAHDSSIASLAESSISFGETSHALDPNPLS